MKLWTGLLVLLLAVAGCSYQGEDPQGASSPDNEKASDGTAAPAVPTPPAEGSEATGTAKTVKKPDAETAARYLEDGHYLWNAGMFVFAVDAVRDSFRQHLPNTWAQLERLRL